MKRPLNYTCLEKLFSYLTLYRRKNITTSATCFVLSIPAYHWRFNILKKSRHIGWADDSLKKRRAQVSLLRLWFGFLASLTCQHTHNSEATCCHDLTRHCTWRTPAVTVWRRTVLRAINVTSQQRDFFDTFTPRRCVSSSPNWRFPCFRHHLNAGWLMRSLLYSKCLIQHER